MRVAGSEVVPVRIGCASLNNGGFWGGISDVWASTQIQRNRRLKIQYQYQRLILVMISRYRDNGDVNANWICACFNE